MLLALDFTLLVVLAAAVWLVFGGILVGHRYSMLRLALADASVWAARPSALCFSRPLCGLMEGLRCWACSPLRAGRAQARTSPHAGKDVTACMKIRQACVSTVFQPVPLLLARRPSTLQR
jgi:hypothetical protein